MMIKKVMLLIMVGFIFSSCSNKDEKEMIGIWDDNIKLSTKHVEITSKIDSVTITTKGDWWWIDAITFKDSTYRCRDKKGLNLESNSYSIIEEHFVVERRDKNTLFVKIDENFTGEKRIMRINFQAGNYFDYVNIIQESN